MNRHLYLNGYKKPEPTVKCFACSEWFYTSELSVEHLLADHPQANGGYSHAEGEQTWAIGNYSHAEESSTIAMGGYSHAEGNGGYAFGVGTVVSG